MASLKSVNIRAPWTFFGAGSGDITKHKQTEIIFDSVLFV